MRRLLIFFALCGASLATVSRLEAACAVSTPMFHGLDSYFICPDIQPVYAFAYELSDPAGANSGTLKIACETFDGVSCLTPRDDRRQPRDHRVRLGEPRGRRLSRLDRQRVPAGRPRRRRGCERRRARIGGFAQRGEPRDRLSCGSGASAQLHLDRRSAAQLRQLRGGVGSVWNDLRPVRQPLRLYRLRFRLVRVQPAEPGARLDVELQRRFPA